MNWVLERVFNYCDDILNGKIKASIKHKWAVQRFLKDYEDCQNDDSPFYFDEEVGEGFYWWANEFEHVEGVLAGQKVELNDFQLFISTNIFCFKKKRNGARRFRKVYIQLARKNAKSQFLVIVGSYIGFLGDEKQRMYIAGWQKDQSNRKEGEKMAFEYLAQYITFDSVTDMDKSVEDHMAVHYYELTESERAIVFKLASHSLEHPGVCHLKAATIAASLEISTKTVYRSIKRLAELGIIEKVPGTKLNGIKGASIYRILPYVPSSVSQRDTVDEASNDKVCPPQSENQASKSFKF